MSEFIDREKAIANIVAVYCCGCEHYNGEKMPRVSDYGRDGCAGRRTGSACD